MRRGTSGWRWQTAIFVILMAVGLLAVSGHTQSVPPPAKRPAASTRGIAENQYVDPALCARCHAEIARNFRKTGMGRSFYRVGPDSPVDFNPGKPFYHEASDSYFAMIERGGKYYQRRWQVGFDGKETNIEEKQVDFVMGSGNHSRTYLHLTQRNTLQQLPLGWYSEKG